MTWFSGPADLHSQSYALAGTLLQSLWEGAVVALVLALTLAATRNSRIRYSASCLAMLVLLGGLVVTFTHLAPARPIAAEVTGSGWAAGAVRAVGHDLPMISTRGGEQADYLSWVAPIWMAGVFAFYLRGIASWVSARRLRRTGVCCAQAVWRSRVDRLRERLRLSRPVVLLESSLAEVPVVVGYLRPVILMPVGLLAGLPVSQVEAILLHELAHIRRYDYLVNLLQVFVEGLLFYHPAIWWISDVMRTEREYCCDDVVVAVTGGAHEYAKALEFLERRRTSPGMAMAATGGSLVNRIQRLLCGAGDLVTCQSTVMPVVTAAMLTIAAVTAVSALQVGSTDREVVPSKVGIVTLVAPVQVPDAPRLSAQVMPPPAAPRPAGRAPVVSTPAPSQAPPVPDYKIGPNDVLSISIAGEPDLSMTIRVRDGKISMPILGPLQAEGLSTHELETELARELVDEKLVAHPAVSVSIKPRITVVGDVKIPGQFGITSPITLLEAMAKAGWTTVDAGPDVLLTTPGSEGPRKINIEQLQTSQDPTVNVMLTGGEVINVPDAPKIWVTGNVAHAQAVPILNPNDATVLKVIARAQGLTQYYAKTAYIYRKDEQGVRREIAIQLKDIMHRKAQDVPLMADDVLSIPNDNGLQLRFYDPRPPVAPWEGAPKAK